MVKNVDIPIYFCKFRNMSNQPPKLILAGGSGFLGSLLARFFSHRGWDVVILTRRARVSPAGTRLVLWDGRTLGPWKAELEGAKALVNLAGVSVDCRYTAKNRQRIMDSRVESTRVLGAAIHNCSSPPPVWLNASTATIYRHTFGPPWDEAGETGAAPEAKDEFSIEVARAWEREFFQAQTPQTRKIALRSAMVLGLGKNSVFPVMRRMVRLGLGGSMASGRQFVSWVHQSDFCRAIEWLIQHHQLTGVVNIAAPEPVPNAELMRIFRNVCRVPIGLPAPQWLLEIGAFFLRTETELVIKSRRVVPGKLLQSGFQFDYPRLEPALHHLEVCSREEPMRPDTPASDRQPLLTVSRADGA